MFKAIVVIVLFGLNALAEEPVLAPSNEVVKPPQLDRFWISGRAGIGLSPLWGFSDSDSMAGVSYEGELRWQFSDFGVLVNWHQNRLEYSTRHQSAEILNRTVGVGATYLLKRMSPNVFNGGILMAQLTYEFGKSEIHGFTLDKEVYAAKVSGNILRGGVDFYWSLFPSVWMTGGAGLEILGFEYNMPEDTGGDGKPNIPSALGFARVGLAVSF